MFQCDSFLTLSILVKVVVSFALSLNQLEFSHISDMFLWYCFHCLCFLCLCPWFQRRYWQSCLVPFAACRDMLAALKWAQVFGHIQAPSLDDECRDVLSEFSRINGLKLRINMFLKIFMPLFFYQIYMLWNLKSKKSYTLLKLRAYWYLAGCLMRWLGTRCVIICCLLHHDAIRPQLHKTGHVFIKWLGLAIVNPFSGHVPTNLLAHCSI